MHRSRCIDNADYGHRPTNFSTHRGPSSPEIPEIANLFWNCPEILNCPQNLSPLVQMSWYCAPKSTIIQIATKIQSLYSAMPNPCKTFFDQNHCFLCKIALVIVMAPFVMYVYHRCTWAHSSHRNRPRLYDADSVPSRTYGTYHSKLHQHNTYAVSFTDVLSGWLKIMHVIILVTKMLNFQQYSSPVSRKTADQTKYEGLKS